MKTAARLHPIAWTALALVAACHDATQPTAPGTRPDQRVSARAAAGAAVPAPASCPYSLATLQAWFELASPAVLSYSGGVFADVNEGTTCLDFGVQDAATQAAAADTLADLGIPSDAYTIEIAAPITTAQAPTLRSRIRPTVGGIQIQFGPAGAGGGVTGTCTLGFNIQQGTRREFVTNDHCTDTRGAVTGTAFFQPVRVGMAGTSIGVEVVDPPFFTRGLFTNLRCPRGRQCRNSDAARVLYNAATASTLGRIARPDGMNNGSLVIDAARPEFATVATAPGVNPALNTTLNKVGRTTGWSQGPVTRSCADVNVAASTITLLCQSQVRANAGGGDSGSPVFSIDDAAGNGTLFGILWGTAVVAGTTHFWYSPFAAVAAELGI